MFWFPWFCLREITDVLKMYCITNISNITQNLNLIAFSTFSTRNGSLHSLLDSLTVYPIHFLEKTAVVVELEYLWPSQLSSKLQRMKTRRYKLCIGDKINNSSFSSTGTKYIPTYCQNKKPLWEISLAPVRLLLLKQKETWVCLYLALTRCSTIPSPLCHQ
jgi:hypothetical protein